MVKTVKFAPGEAVALDHLAATLETPVDHVIREAVLGWHGIEREGQLDGRNGGQPAQDAGQDRGHVLGAPGERADG